MGILGFVLPAATIGLGSLLLKPQQRGFLPEDAGQPITAQITLEEMHHDEMTITEHPVEVGAPISDHAYMRPAEVVIRCMWSNSPSKPQGMIGQAVGAASAIGGSILGALASAGSTIDAASSLLNGKDVGQANSIYEKLLALQASRVPFTIFTGKRKYENMLFRSISVTTDIKTENSLLITVVCKQIILVSSRVVSTTVDNKLVDADMAPAVCSPDDFGSLSLSMPDLPDFTNIPGFPDLSGGLGIVSSAISSAASGVLDGLPTLSDLTALNVGGLPNLPDLINLPALPNIKSLAGGKLPSISSVLSLLPNPNAGGT